MSDLLLFIVGFRFRGTGVFSQTSLSLETVTCGKQKLILDCSLVKDYHGKQGLPVVAILTKIQEDES